MEQKKTTADVYTLPGAINITVSSHTGNSFTYTRRRVKHSKLGFIRFLVLSNHHHVNHIRKRINLTHPSDIDRIYKLARPLVYRDPCVAVRTLMRN